MRALGTSLMALLIVAALFWGNCFSCPQLLLASSHGCCHHSKAPKDDCKTQDLRSFVKAEKSAPVAIVTQTALSIVPLVAATDEPLVLEGPRASSLHLAVPLRI